MKFRLIIESDEVIVITEDGGIACIREAEALSNDEPRIATTDYYQSRITDFDSIYLTDLFERLAEGKMHYEDWPTTPFNSMVAINDALNWLCPDVTDWEITNDLFAELFDGEQEISTLIDYVVHDTDRVEIEGVCIDNILFDEEKVNYRFIDREDEIHNLYQWIGEAYSYNADEHARSNAEVMKESLDELKSYEDDYILGAIGTNEFISPTEHTQAFNERCQEILTAQKNLPQSLTTTADL